MRERLRLLFVVPWKEEGQWYLYRDFRTRFSHVEVLDISCLSSFLKKPGTPGCRLSEFYLPFLAFRRRKDFDVVLSWSMRIGICYGAIERLFSRQPGPMHIVRDFHINLDRTSPTYRFRLRALRFAIPRMDLVLTTSQIEQSIYQHIFNLPPDRIFFFPDAFPTQFLAHKPPPVQDSYLFAYGNSDRDFSTLLRAVKKLDIKTIILSQNFTPHQKDITPHVQVINEKVSEDVLIRLIESARAVVLPLRSNKTAAGQNVMLESMALGKTVIVTANPATLEYARDGHSALFFVAGDWKQLRQIITATISDPRKAEQIGRNAKKQVQNMPLQQADALFTILKNRFDLECVARRDRAEIRL